MNHFLTKEKFEELTLELEERKTKTRREIADMIREAKDFGDLSENAAYKDARDQESFNESRVQYLEELLRDAQIVEQNGKSNKIQLGTTFTMKLEGTEREFQLVDTQEADPQNGKLSKDSPIGMAAIEKKVGDKVQVETPQGKMSYVITKIS